MMMTITRQWRSLRLALTTVTLTTVVCFAVLLSGCQLLPAPTAIATAPTTTGDSVYQQKTPSRDGIGKVYEGREIAQVMGHLGAGWLERPSREREEQPQKLIAALNLKPTDVVADIGAGTGYFSFRLSPLVPQGKVLAVDIQPEMLEIVNAIKQEKKITNVETVLGSITNPNLKDASIDLALMVDAYHEFDHPKEMMTAIVQALKPNGRVVLVEYRGENPLIPIKALHKMTQKQARKEMTVVGLTWLETKETLPQQHILFFGKQGARSQESGVRSQQANV